MNHQNFERTLRPLVLQGACLSECQRTPLGSGPLGCLLVCALVRCMACLRQSLEVDMSLYWKCTPLYRRSPPVHQLVPDRIVIVCFLCVRATPRVSRVCWRHQRQVLPAWICHSARLRCRGIGVQVKEAGGCRCLVWHGVPLLISAQARQPAEFKHIIKRRKRN